MEKERGISKWALISLIGLLLSITSLIIIIIGRPDRSHSPIKDSLVFPALILIPISIILAVIGLFKSNKKSKFLSIATILLVLIVAYNYSQYPLYYPSGSPCMVAQLDLEEINSSDNTITIKRLAGGADGDVTGITILIEGIEAEILTPQEQGLKQLETKTYKVDYDIQPGDEIKVGALIGTDKWKCNPVSSKTAE